MILLCTSNVVVISVGELWNLPSVSFEENIIGFCHPFKDCTCSVPNLRTDIAVKRYIPAGLVPGAHNLNKTFLLQVVDTKSSRWYIVSGPIFTKGRIPLELSLAGSNS